MAMVDNFFSPDFSKDKKYRSRKIFPKTKSDTEKIP